MRSKNEAIYLGLVFLVMNCANVIGRHVWLDAPPAHLGLARMATSLDIGRHAWLDAPPAHLYISVSIELRQ